MIGLGDEMLYTGGSACFDEMSGTYKPGCAEPVVSFRTPGLIVSNDPIPAPLDQSLAIQRAPFGVAPAMPAWLPWALGAVAVLFLFSGRR